MIKRGLVILSVLVSVLFVTQLVMANELSSRGTDMHQLAARREVLQRDIRSLKAEVASLGSLSEIEDRALELKFVRRTSAADFLAFPKLAQAQ